MDTKDPIADIAKMCQVAIDSYRSINSLTITAGQFMAGAATWNYNPSRDRAFERLQKLGRLNER